MHKDAIKIGGETKAPDCSLPVGGNRKFFVEAKKPASPLRITPIPPINSLVTRSRPISPLRILTNFQAFAIYAGRLKPAASDQAPVVHLLCCRYDELEPHGDFIASTFSKEAVLKVSFDKYTATTKGKRGTSTVDDTFFEEIKKWRTLLARNLWLDTRALNFAVQRTIDLIVFLRIADGRLHGLPDAQPGRVAQYLAQAKPPAQRSGCGGMV